MSTTTPLRDGPVPKHARLRDALATQAQALGADEAIASERELMATYEVSRATVRRAIESLIADGVLQRIPGKGTFVARHRVESHLHLASFTDDMRRRGLSPSTRVVASAVRTPDDEVAAALTLDAGEQAWLVERVRLADGRPMAYERGWYPARLFPDLDRHDLTGSLYAVMTEHYGGLAPDTAEQTAWADQARTAARHLGVSATSPVMIFDRTSRCAGRPVEHVRSWYRGDRYQLHMSLDLTMTPSSEHPSSEHP